MIPILFAPGTTDFSTNGIGRLTEAITCIVKEVLNGIYELEMTYPTTGQWFNSIKHSSIIYALNFDGGSNQAFRVYEITTPSRGSVTIYCEHISYQTNWIPVGAFEASSLADCLTKIKSNSAESNPFALYTNKSVSSPISFLKPKSLRAMLGGEEGSVLQNYKGEYEWDNFKINLWNKRGSDNGVTLRYGKNITTLEQETNIENTYTGVYPYWYSEDTGTLVTLPEKVIHTDQASNFPFQRTAVIDFSDKFDDPPEVYALRNATSSYISQNNIGHPNVNIKVEFVALWQSVDYNNLAPLERVKLGDTITVIFDTLGITEQAEVIEYEFDVLKERYNSIQIGDAKSTLSQTIAQINSVMEINNEKAKEYASKATYWLTKGDGYLYIVRGADGAWRELIAMDTPNYKTAKKVLRLNQYGIGFSDSGVDGPYYQAWTLDGIMTLGGLNNSYGQLKLLNPSGQTVATFTKDGIHFSSNGVVSDENANGVTTRAGQGTSVSFTATNGIQFFSNSKKTLSLGYDGFNIYDNNNERLTASYSPSGVLFYDPTKASQQYLAAFDTNGVRLYNGNKLASKFTQTDVTLYESSYEVARFDADGVTLSKRSKVVAQFKSDGSYFYTTSERLLASYNTSGIILYNTSGREVLRIDTNGLKISNNGTVVADFNTTGINLYKNGKTIAKYDNSGNIIYDTSGNIVAQFDSSGLKTYRSGNPVAEFTDGIRLYGRYNNTKTPLASFDTSGNILYDRSGNEAIKIDTTGVYLNSGTKKVAEFNSNGLKLYKSGNIVAEFLSDGLYLYNSSSGNHTATFSKTGNIMYDSYGQVITNFDKDGLTFYQNNVMVGDFSRKGIEFYDTNGKMTTQFSQAGLKFYQNGKMLGNFSNSGILLYDGNDIKLADFSKKGIALYDANGKEISKFDSNGLKISSDGTTLAQYIKSGITLYSSGSPTIAMTKSSIDLKSYDSSGAVSAQLAFNQNGIEISKTSGGKKVTVSNSQIEVISTNSDNTQNFIRIGDQRIEIYYKYKNSNTWESRTILGRDGNNQFIELGSPNGTLQMSTDKGFFINDKKGKTVAALNDDSFFVGYKEGLTTGVLTTLTGIDLDVLDSEFTMEYDTLDLEFLGGLCVMADDGHEKP